MRKDVALALLGLQDGELDDARINAAYRIAIQMNHPDKYSSNDRLRMHAEEQCKLINEAREVLLSRSWEKDTAYERAESSRDNDEHAECEYRKEEQEERKNDFKVDDQVSTHEKPSQGVQVSFTPFLDIWRTSVGASIAGILFFCVILDIEYLVPETYMIAASLLRLAYMVFQFLYAIILFPSYFSLKPKITNSSAVAFWNCAVGGIIFGPIWNSSLTKRKKGISNIVFAVLVGLLAVFWLLSFGFMLSLLAMRY